MPLHRLRDSLAGLMMRCVNLGKRAIQSHYGLFLRSASLGSQTVEQLSPYAAWRSAMQAARTVPAYQEFLRQATWTDDPQLTIRERIARLPVMDKENYIKAHPTEARCQGGRIPLYGVQIDESSGSSGRPYNWVRSSIELVELHNMVSQFTRYYFGLNLITINGFSMGAWATGTNIGEAMRKHTLVKSTGPDVDKILDTLRFFGSGYGYIITGYPPFLKHLLDEGDARGFDWSQYRLFGLVGGEGMTEEVRAYLEQRFVKVYSGYGATDLDPGMAAEMPLTVWLRQQAVANPGLRKALFGDDPRLPMLFQYNPLDYYFETNAEQELIVTVNRLRVLTPKIRYNIHDAGGVRTFAEVMQLVREFGLDPHAAVHRPEQPIFQIPFLYLFGRSDETISYMGANIYPAEIEHALFVENGDAQRLGDYCLELVAIGAGVEQRPCVHVEVKHGALEDTALAERIRERVLQRLLEANRDFRAAYSEDSTVGEIQVRLHATGDGPFAVNRNRIKRRYILRDGGR